MRLSNGKLLYLNAFTKSVCQNTIKITLIQPLKLKHRKKTSPDYIHSCADMLYIGLY